MKGKDLKNHLLEHEILGVDEAIAAASNSGGGGGGGGGVTNHSLLTNLDYASAGHTGFLEDTNDSINDTHIDWGTGANQISQDNVVDGSTYKQYDPTTVLLLDQTTSQTIINGFPEYEEGHAAFSEKHQLIDKEYVDDITIGTYFDFYAYDDDSDVAGYKELKLTPSAGAEVEGSISIAGNATAQAVGVRITEDTIDVPELMTVISSGVFTFHVHMRAATANRIKFYAKLYVRAADDSETLICTTIPTDFIEVAASHYNSHGSILENVTLVAGDRLVVKGYTSNASPAATDLWIAVEGDTTTRINLAGISTPVNLSEYLLADGSRALAGAWDMDNQNLTNVDIDTGDIATAVTNTEWDAAYSHVSADGSSHSAVVVNSAHSADNSQAHSDYLINNGDDTTSGKLTATGGFSTPNDVLVTSDNKGLILGAGQDSKLYFDGTDTKLDATGSFEVTTTDNVPVLFRGEAAGGNIAVQFMNNAAANVANTTTISLYGRTLTTEKSAGAIRAGFTNITDATRKSHLSFLTAIGGSFASRLEITDTGITQAKHDIDVVDRGVTSQGYKIGDKFVIEIDNADNLIIDGDNNLAGTFLYGGISNKITLGDGSGDDTTAIRGDMTITKEIVQESWNNVSFVNSWVNFGGAHATAQYYKDTQGTVNLKGLIKSGTIPATAFTLPLNYRPAEKYIFSTISEGAFGRITVDTDGTVDVDIGKGAFGRITVDTDGTVDVDIGSNVWVSLAGITFRAA